MQSTVCKGDIVRNASTWNDEALRLLLNRVHPQSPNPAIGRMVLRPLVLVEDRILREIVEPTLSRVLQELQQRNRFFYVIQGFPFA